MDVLKKVRARNPDAWIVWAFGMLGEGRMGAVLRAAVARAAAECGDSRMCYLALPAATPDTMGARQHPGAACHRQAAQVLTERLRSILSAGEQRFPL